MAQIDIMSAIRQIAAERNIDQDLILNAIKQALVSSYSDQVGDENLDRLHAEVDPEAGHIAVYAQKEVVKSVKNDILEITLEEAKKVDSKAKMGEIIEVDITPEGDFGRIVAQTSKQIIHQSLVEAERDTALEKVKKNLGTIDTVTIRRVHPNGDVICEIKKAKAVMPKAERIDREFYKLGGRIKVLLKEIVDEEKGKYVLISRADPKFLEELFKLEIPEIDSGTVEIISIAREAGSRSKVAVKSNSDGVDPIGSCVGQRGVRINAIMNELKVGEIEEKIDIILWDEEIKTYLMNAIRPAEAIKVNITDEDEKKAEIVVPDEQQSLAIGKDGQNVRLAHKLTGWTLDIISESESKGEKPKVKKEDEEDDDVEKPSDEEKDEKVEVEKTKDKSEPAVEEEKDVEEDNADKKESDEPVEGDDVEQQ